MWKMKSIHIVVNTKITNWRLIEHEAKIIDDVYMNRPIMVVGWLMVAVVVALLVIVAVVVVPAVWFLYWLLIATDSHLFTIFIHLFWKQVTVIVCNKLHWSQWWMRREKPPNGLHRRFAPFARNTVNTWPLRRIGSELFAQNKTVPNNIRWSSIDNTKKIYEQTNKRPARKHAWTQQYGLPETNDVFDFDETVWLLHTYCPDIFENRSFRGGI